jgi:hypothetical protein
MQCPNCRQVIPENAQFCMHCGRSISYTSSASTSTAASSGKAKWVAIALGVLILAGLAFFAGKQAGLFTQAQVHTPDGPSVLQADAPRPEGPSVLQADAPRPEGPSMLQTETLKPPEKNPPPKHVIDWLEHLRKIEMKRRAMRNDFTPALDMLKNALSMKAEIEEEQQVEKQQNISQGYEKYAQNWYQLVNDYQSVQPPPECKKLADTYYVALQNYVQFMLKIQEAMHKQDISALMNMRGSAQGNVDQQLVQSDVELAIVCRQYDIRKYFDIEADSDMKSMLGFGF